MNIIKIQPVSSPLSGFEVTADLAHPTQRQSVQAIIDALQTSARAPHQKVVREIHDKAWAAADVEAEEAASLISFHMDRSSAERVESYLARIYRDRKFYPDQGHSDLHVVLELQITLVPAVQPAVAVAEQ